MKNKRAGFFDLTSGVASYPIVFSPPFDFPPNIVEGVLQLAGAGSEFFTVAANKATITPAGATLLLSGTPGDTSVGSRITWKAKL
jgi:hypothetical protein